MSLSHAIMGFLSVGEMTGYDLKTRCFDRSAAHYWPADQAQIYRTLDRLEREGLVCSHIEVQRGRPDRIVYSLTEEGNRVLLEWLKTRHPAPPDRDPLLVQVAFADHLPDTAVLDLLTTIQSERHARLEALRADASRLETCTRGLPERALMFRRMTYEAAMAKERATIEWLEDSIEAVSSSATDRRKKGPPRKRPLE